jgi:predicted transcriptional regulator
MVKLLKRERGEIVTAILEGALGGAKKTHIMHRANLNHRMVDKYIQMLLDAGLIAKCNDPDRGVLYKTTEKGRDFLRLGRQFYERLKLK